MVVPLSSSSHLPLPSSKPFNSIPSHPSTFYFENFPPNWDHLAFRKLFSKYGKVLSTYVSPRVNKAGRKFGFLKIFDIHDSPNLLASLSSIWIGSYKLRVNPAKFIQSTVKPLEKHHLLNSYAMVAKGILGPQPSNTTTNCLRPPPQPKALPQNTNCSSFKPDTQNLEWLSRCAIGIVLSPDSIPCLYDSISADTSHEVNIIPMGGNMVLLSFISKDAMSIFLSDDPLIKNWFELVKPWDPSFVSCSRFVWLKCYGIPAHVWGQEFFSSMVSHFGKFVHSDVATSSLSRLDFARILISTTDCLFISKTLSYSIDNELYNIQVAEDPSLDFLDMLISQYKKTSYPSPLDFSV